MELSIAFFAGFLGGLFSSGLVIGIVAYKLKKKINNSPLGGMM